MENNVIYAFAHVETWLEEFAKQKHLNPQELILEVSGLLRNGGQVAVPQQTNGVARVTKRGKPNGGPASYWAKLTPLQRSKEMKRRQAVSAGKAEPRKLPRKSKLPMGGVA
jgi:hypothetical protein